VEKTRALIHKSSEHIAHILPEHSSQIVDNAKQLNQRLEANLEQWKQVIPRNKTLISSHDAFSYLESEFEIQNLNSLYDTNAKFTGAKTLTHSKELVENQKVDCILIDTSHAHQLVDRINTNNTAMIELDANAWDYKGVAYSEWLLQIYGKLSGCFK
jgi:ABC-type Zn2+ transport system substrate-binding protein/surface adhesin